jgi:hypothetical protein
MPYGGNGELDAGTDGHDFPQYPALQGEAGRHRMCVDFAICFMSSQHPGRHAREALNRTR